MKSFWNLPATSVCPYCGKAITIEESHADVVRIPPPPNHGRPLGGRALRKWRESHLADGRRL